VLRALGGATERIKPEIFRSMIEVDTGICRSVGEVRADLERSFAALHAAGEKVGVEIASSGTHPFADHTERLLYPSKRYRELLERNAWIARRLLIFGLHVHVGMRDGDHAVQTMGVLCRYLGHLLALSASSPFWRGEDTGLASARITIFESIPTAGTPPTFQTWAEFEGYYDMMIASKSIGSMKDFWWDVRPSPGFGTLEVRICDCPPTLDETLAIVALVQCLAVMADAEIARGSVGKPPPAWFMRENKWRAARHGVDAAMLVDDEGHTRPLRDHLRELVATLRPIAAQLGCSAELERIPGILARGTGADRQRRVFTQTGSLPAVAATLVEEFRSNAPLALSEEDVQRRIDEEGA
jgi:YbdK family carboxylate-amine ligase